MNAHRYLTIITNFVVVAALAAIVFVSNSTIEAPKGGWSASGAIEQEQAAQTLAAKPHNVWTTKALEDAGFAGCVKVQSADEALANPPVAHVVRLPVAEGWDWVRMDASEVAARMGVFGGTSTTSDDVKIVGNCF